MGTHSYGSGHFGKLGEESVAGIADSLRAISGQLTRKAESRVRVLLALYTYSFPDPEHGATSSVGTIKLARAAGVSQGTASRALSDLVDSGIVREVGTHERGETPTYSFAWLAEDYDPAQLKAMSKGKPRGRSYTKENIVTTAANVTMSDEGNIVTTAANVTMSDGVKHSHHSGDTYSPQHATVTSKEEELTPDVAPEARRPEVDADNSTDIESRVTESILRNINVWS